MNYLHRQNTKYDLVIFDFDGTIADTSPGIIDSHKFALKQMNAIIPSYEELLKLIGGNLLNIYTNIFKFKEEDARLAIKIYRDRYAKVGIHMANLYPNFEELLIELKAYGIKIGVATLKAERFAIAMLNELGISKYFDVICGMDENDTMTKSDLINKCCDLCNINKDKTILIGDSMNDYKGSIKSNISFLGVTYGFGIKNCNNYDFDTVNTCTNVLRYIIKNS